MHQTFITFTYSSNPQNTYVVHYVDRDSGSQLKSNTTMTSPEVLIALDAPRIANYTVDGDGHGYVSLRIHEWTFFYTKDSAPTTPTTPATPSTPDTSNPPTTGAQTPGTTTPPSSSQQNPTSTSRDRRSPMALSFQLILATRTPQLRTRICHKLAAKAFDSWG